jgi:hypothetical protein
VRDPVGGSDSLAGQIEACRTRGEDEGPGSFFVDFVCFLFIHQFWVLLFSSRQAGRPVSPGAPSPCAHTQVRQMLVDAGRCWEMGG